MSESIKGLHPLALAFLDARAAGYRASQACDAGNLESDEDAWNAVDDAAAAWEAAGCPRREDEGIRLHKCAGPSCPGFPYRASDIAHPASCAEPPNKITVRSTDGRPLAAFSYTPGDVVPLVQDDNEAYVRELAHLAAILAAPRPGYSAAKCVADALEILKESRSALQVHLVLKVKPEP